MLKRDGDKRIVQIVFEERQLTFVDAKAEKMGLSRSAYLRMLVAREAEKEERREMEG